MSVYNVFQTTALQHDLPNELIARATSVLMLGGLIAMPVGMGLAGPIAAALGTRAVLGTVAGIAVLVTVGTLVIPAVWRVHGASTSSADATTADDPATTEPAL